jgi:ribosomal protein S18 acetylase RimI-like enzyme
MDVLLAIGKQTFQETFAPHNSEQNMIQYLNESFTAQRLAAEIGNEGSEFYFALLGDRVVGYMKLNSGASQTEIKESNGIEIERIYVLKEYHGKQVGQLLFEWAMEIACDRKFDYVWLGVWEYNKRAIRFYEKNGFVPFDTHVFRLGEDVQTDIMMKKELLQKNLRS